MPAIATENFDRFEIESTSDLRTWLQSNHDRAESFWLVTYMKSTPEKYVSRDEVLDELVAYGWIDGIRRKLGDEKTMQLISPRKTQYWAKTYKDRALKLIESDRMTPSGLKSMEDGKANGLWSFMDDVDALIIPSDLASVLANLADATKNFDNAAPSYKRNVLRWLKLAKTEKTRTVRLQKIADYAARNEKIAQM